jgi:DNA-directed RNA polymerase specialized sigma24 family protein
VKTWNFRLDEKDSQVLDDFLKKSKEELRAVILLLLDKGMTNIEIADVLGIHQTICQ